MDEDGNPTTGLDDNSSLGGATHSTTGDALPPDYYVNPDNWKSAPLPVRAYLSLCYPCYLELEEGTRFNGRRLSALRDDALHHPPRGLRHAVDPGLPGEAENLLLLDESRVPRNARRACRSSYTG